MPAGITAGQLLLSECLIEANLTLTVSAGWTIIKQINLGAGNYTYGVAWRKATGSGDQPVWSWGGSSQHYGANVWRYTGPWSGSVLIGASSIAAGNSTTAGSAAITATSANAYIISFTTTPANAAVPLPSGFTSDSNFSGGTAPSGAERASHKQLTNVGDSSGSNSVTITSGKWASSQIEVFSQAPNEQATIDQTLSGAISQEADVIVAANNAAISQTFANISQSLTATETETSTISQTFANISQALTANSTHEVDGDIDQTLPGAIQELLTAVEIEAISITSLFFPMEQDFEASVGGGAHIIQTLPGLLQEAIVVSEIVIDTIDQTLPGAIQQVLECDQTPPVIIRMTFGTMVQEFDAVVEVPTYIDMTFISMDDYPRFAEIDMTFGSGGDCDSSSSNSRSGWWAGP